MTNIIIGAVTRMREIVDANRKIPQIPGNKIKIDAIEDEKCGIKLLGLELATKDGCVRVDDKRMYWVQFGGYSV